MSSLDQTNPWLRRVSFEEFAAHDRVPVDEATLSGAQRIVERIQHDGVKGLRAMAEKFDGLGNEEPLFLDAKEMQAACDRIDREDLAVLQRTASRIENFAEQQRACLSNLDIPLLGGRAGHQVVPVRRAGCYAPGGRFPLPSSVLMTAVTARVAGVNSIVLASPNPSPMVLAAGAVAGAEQCLVVGGAHAVAALAYGVEGFEPVDLIVGPGNRWVTAAKQLVSGRVGIDMLAGPSELLVVADRTANPQRVAADLLAQAEHDADAVPILVTQDPGLPETVEAALHSQLDSLSTGEVARQALANGCCVLCCDLNQVATVCNSVAPEHLEIMIDDPQELIPHLHHYGALFVGSDAAEVFGDYGVGPNHVLPTGRSSRYRGGLSVMTFLRVRTWMQAGSGESDPQTIRDCVRLAELEGLMGHARAAAMRLPS